MNDSLDEIKSRLSIEDLVSQYVQLKKVGQNFKGLCPFHNEKTPSFIVSPEKGIAYCFGCNRGGDIFKFLQELEGVDFPDALKILAERTGVQLRRDFSQSTGIAGEKNEKEQLLQIHEVAAAFYQDQLWNTQDGAKVLAYLYQRGLRDDTIRLFRLGFAPDDYDMTWKKLINDGFSRKLIVASGLASSNETTVDKIYDRFRRRLMFPVADHLGRIVAFGGRSLKKEQEPKYLNSPETSIYHKSKILYGLFHAKSAIKEQKSAVIVEGYMDMITAYQAKTVNTVAVSGTALTAYQLRLIKPFVKELYLAFDMDLAGQDAAKRAFELTQEFEFEVKIIELPHGKDIAEFVKHNESQLASIIKKANLYGDYLLKYLLNRSKAEVQHNVAIRSQQTSANETIDFLAKRKILVEFSPFLNTLKSSIAKDNYIRRLANDLNLTARQIYDELANLKLPQAHPARLRSNIAENANISNPIAKKFQAEELFIAFMIEYPRIGMLFKDRIPVDCFSSYAKAIYKLFCDQYNALGDAVGESFFSVLPYEIAKKASLVSLYISEFYGEIGEEAAEREMRFLLDRIIKNDLSNKRRMLHQQIVDAEKAGQKDSYKKLIVAMDALNT